MNLIQAQNCTLFSWNENNSVYDSVYNGANFNQYLDSLTQSGFYALSIISRKINPCEIYFNKGGQYKKIYLTGFENSGKFIEKDTVNNRFYTLNLDGYIQFLKDSLESSGRPFSKISIQPRGYFNQLNVAEISVDNDSVRMIDALKFVGYDKIPRFIEKEILRKNLNYSPENIGRIQQEIESYTLLESYNTPKTSFTKDSTTLYIYVKKRRLSFFDGLLGFETDEEGKFSLQGNVKIALLNAFNRFEKLDLTWQSGLNKSQNLNFNVHIPYLFNSRLGFNSQLNLQKQDSSFIRLQMRNGLFYQFSPAHYIGGNFNHAGSNFINASQTGQADYSKSGFGISYFYQDGISSLFQQNKTLINFISGLWKLNNKTDEGVKTQQTEIVYNLQRQQKIGGNHYIFSSLSGNNLIQKENYLENDLYIVGGFTSLRGFNQNSIVTPSFNMATLAYRYIPSNHILFEIFSDLALIKSKDNTNTQLLNSAGLGMQFFTRFGIFQLNYATGKTETTQFDFSSGKIHLGITGYF